MLLPNIKLSEIIDDFTYYEIKTEKKKYDGSYIEIKKNEKEVSIEVDIFSRIPFYYYVSKNEIFGNTNFIELVKELKIKKLPLTFDCVSIAAFLKNNCFLETSTYFKEILMVPPASKLIFNYLSGSTTIQQYYKFQNHVLKETNKELCDNYIDMLKKNFQSYIETNKFDKIGISLTGGYDSRMILSVLDYIKANVIAFHYGHKKSNDFKVTKIICDKYNIESKVNEWRDLSYFKTNTKSILEDADFMLPIHHCHLHEILSDQVKEVDTVFYGHFMDMQMQSHFYNKDFDGEKSQKKILKSLKKMWCGEPSAFSVLSAKTFKKIFSKEIIKKYNIQIENMLKKYIYLDSDKQYEISYLLNHGTRRAIAQCQLASKKVDYYIPALQKGVFEIIWNVDTKTKKRRRLQNLIFKNIFKKASEIDFVLDNYKITNLQKDGFFQKNIEILFNFLRSPKIKLLKPYFDFWGKEYHKFDNYKSWMINFILINKKILDKEIINEKIFSLMRDDANSLPFAFISSFFTVVNFILFYKKLD